MATTSGINNTPAPAGSTAAADPSADQPVSGGSPAAQATTAAASLAEKAQPLSHDERRPDSIAPDSGAAEEQTEPSTTPKENEGPSAEDLDKAYGADDD